MFFSKDKSKNKTEWSINYDYLTNNYNNKKYHREELYIAYPNESEIVTFWYNGKFLVTLQCSESTRRLLEEHFQQRTLKDSSKYLIPVTFRFKSIDHNKDEWELEDFHLCNDKEKLPFYCLRFVSNGDYISVYKYGKFITTLHSNDLTTLNAIKESIIKQSCLRLDKSIDKKLEQEEFQKRDTQLHKLSDATLNKIIVTTEMSSPFEVVERLGIITSECAFGMNLFKDVFAALSDVFGGRNKSIQNTLRDAKNHAIKELKREAYRLGANAVIAVDLDYSEFSGGGKSMLFIVASGTAVKIKN